MQNVLMIVDKRCMATAAAHKDVLIPCESREDTTNSAS